MRPCCSRGRCPRPKVMQRAKFQALASLRPATPDHAAPRADAINLRATHHPPELRFLRTEARSEQTQMNTRAYTGASSVKHWLVIGASDSASPQLVRMACPGVRSAHSEPGRTNPETGPNRGLLPIIAESGWSRQTPTSATNTALNADRRAENQRRSGAIGRNCAAIPVLAAQFRIIAPIPYA